MQNIFIHILLPSLIAINLCLKNFKSYYVALSHNPGLGDHCLVNEKLMKFIVMIENNGVKCQKDLKCK